MKSTININRMNILVVTNSKSERRANGREANYRAVSVIIDQIVAVNNPKATSLAL
jgi:hypothetical protein